MPETPPNGTSPEFPSWLGPPPGPPLEPWRPPKEGLPRAGDTYQHTDTLDSPETPKRRWMIGAGAIIATLAMVGGSYSLANDSGGETPQRQAPSEQPSEAFDGAATTTAESNVTEFPWQPYDESGPLVQDIDWANRKAYNAEQNGRSYSHDSQRYYNQILGGAEASPKMAGANIILFSEQADGRIGTAKSMLTRLGSGDLTLLTSGHTVENAQADTVYAYAAGSGSVPLGVMSSQRTVPIDLGAGDDPATAIILEGEVLEFFESQIAAGSLHEYTIADTMPQEGGTVYLYNSFSGTRSEFVFTGYGLDYPIAIGTQNSPVFVGASNALTNDALSDGSLDYGEFTALVESVGDEQYHIRNILFGDISICDGGSGSGLVNSNDQIVALANEIPAGFDNDTSEQISYGLSDVPINCNFVVVGAPLVPRDNP